MITNVTAKNLESGEQVVMVLARPLISEGFAITKMDGLGPGDATINVNDWVTIDGGSFSYAHRSARTISFNIRFLTTNHSETIADIRRKTYRYFPLKKKVRLTFDFFDAHNNEKNYFIDGYVKTNEPDIWSREEETKIVIECPNPYFQNTEVLTGRVSSVNPRFHFIFPEESMIGSIAEDDTSFLISEKSSSNERSIITDSSVDVGGEFELEAKSIVINPAIYNRTTNEYFKLNYKMKPGECLLIDTRPGHKSITSADGLFTSKINHLAANSKWVHFMPGENAIGVTADKNGDKLVLNYKIRSMYQGV